MVFESKTCLNVISIPKPLQTRMQIDVKNFFCRSSGCGDILEQQNFRNQLDVFFVTHCTLTNILKIV